MYTVTIYDKSKKVFKSYRFIRSIKYFDLSDGQWITVSENDILSHEFPMDCTYQLLSETANYNIDKGIIGSIEIEKET